MFCLDGLSVDNVKLKLLTVSSPRVIITTTDLHFPPY